MKLTWAEREATYKSIAAWCEHNEHITHISNGRVNVVIHESSINEHVVSVPVDLSATAPSHYVSAIAQAVFEAGRIQGANAVRDAINKILETE